MIVFTMIGISLGCMFFLLVAAIGLIQALYNDIGGNGSAAETIIGIVIFAAGIAGFVWIIGLSPVSISVTP